MSEFNKIQFNWIKAQNFLSITEEMHFDFNRHYGVNYIFGHNSDVADGGKNGVGKSVLFVDSILFALFGKTSKKLSKNNVINRVAGKKCIVSINFNINGNNYEVENGISPTYVKLLKNGEDITKSTIVETRDHLTREILKTTYSIFKNSIVLSVNDSNSIFEMSAHEKREFIEKVFNLSIFGKMFQDVRKDINQLDKDFILCQNNFTKLGKDLLQFKDKQLSFNNDKSKTISSLKEKAKDISSKIKNLYLHDINESDLDKYNAAKEKVGALLKANDDNKRDIEYEIRSLEKDIKTKNTIIKKYENIYNLVGNCCKPLLDDELDFNNNKEAISTAESNIKLKKEKLDETENVRCDLDKKFKTINNKILEHNKKKNDNQRAKTDKEILHNNIQNIKEKMLEVNKKTSPYNDLIREYEDKRKQCESEIQDLCEKRKYLEFCEYVLSTDGVKKWIISNLVNMLNNRISKYLEEMGANYSAIFDPDFSCKFLTTTGECDYHNFSSGEKMRINHSVVFSIRDILASQGTLSSSIMVCDEIIDSSIDSVCIDALFEILKRESKDKAIFLISHREELSSKDEIDNVIELVKENGVTKIVSDPAMDGM